MGRERGWRELQSRLTKQGLDKTRLHGVHVLLLHVRVPARRRPLRAHALLGRRPRCWRPTGRRGYPQQWSGRQVVRRGCPCLALDAVCHLTPRLPGPRCSRRPLAATSAIRSLACRIRRRHRDLAKQQFALCFPGASGAELGPKDDHETQRVSSRRHEHRGSVAADLQTFSFINRESAQGFHYLAGQKEILFGYPIA